ncbi:MAG: virB8 family protein [Betaproteobacteria bacterium HGW-Betaproteobacteria-22]|nr:MAG: virB8 family protein [Betaproteobacteria bacterium HGW-Betaproteobacteria-22]
MATKVEKAHFESYLAEAKSWESDKVHALQKSARTAWIVTIFFGVLAVLSVVALAMLTPFKTAVPYVIRVDNATGSVDIVNALVDGKTTYDEVMNKYHIQWYVRWREGYSKPIVSDYYKNVGLTSVPAEQAKYVEIMRPSNPNSPLNVLGEKGVINIAIKSTSFIKQNVALVRYTKEVVNGSSRNLSHWAATIVFKYSGTPMAESDRAINPLGFQVLEYRNDPDQEVSGLTSTRTVSPQPSNTAAQTVPSIQ